MRNFILAAPLLVILSCAQPPSQRVINKLPLGVSNNAVTAINLSGKEYIYSFGGIDNTKSHSGITLKSFRYSVSENQWDEIDPLPDTMPKIAAAASVVKGKIYIIGGYYVFPDGHEKSSAKVHVYDPEANQYLENGADLPTPIDDQVQAVWNDSLIYVASGWSDSLNVNHVQVYTPGEHWHYATFLPDTPGFKVFGSSGFFVGNDVYFAGGAGNGREAKFPIQSSIKIGHINPENPLEIEWEEITDSLAGIYRPAAVVINNKPHWIGGSSKSYNYNGIAYTGGGVNPVTKGRYFDPATERMSFVDWSVPQVMDLRGIAELSDGNLAIVGGMSPNQQVSNEVVIIDFELR